MAALGSLLPRLYGFGFLLAAMLADLIIGPLVAIADGSLAIVHLLTGLVLLAVLAVVGGRKVALVLFCAAVLAHILATVTHASAPVVVSALIRMIFFCYAIGLIIRRVLRERAVTLETVAGAACAYMLLAMVWGDLYLTVETLRPGSFHLPPGWVTGPSQTLRAALVYFSFATLTTLGYGEIHPNNPASGSLCDAEALVGQLYLAIMVARLVSLEVSQRGR